MRAFIAIAICLAGCTKPNPDLCCNDAADCAAQNLPVDDACGEGLVCRGNQCIAETCSDASECDAAAPYCIGDACAEQCTMDEQCPGFGGASTDPFCVGGSCVECRDSTDCSRNTPICDANACRGCNANTDCSSGLCNLSTGACVAASALLYASPGGAETAACTEADPCSITHAIASVTTSLDSILMAPGTYAATITINSGATMTLLGAGASLGARLTVMSNSKVTIQDLDVASGMWCFDTSAAPDSELNLVRTTIAADAMEFKVEHCHLSMSEVSFVDDKFESTVMNLFTEGTVTADRSVVPRIELDSQPIDASLTITNSIFGLIGTPGAGVNAVTIQISFSTFRNEYGAFFGCTASSTIGVVEHLANVIFYTPSPENALLGDDTCFDHDIMFPAFGTTPPGVTVADPMFKDPTNGDYHLTVGSPAIDTGDSSATDPDDFDGVSRPQGAGFDIGAFEYH